MRLAERFREVVKAAPYALPGTTALVSTISIGGATTQRGGSHKKLIHRADQAL